MQAKDDRYLFALEILPISQMNISELINAPDTDTTPNPFEDSIIEPEMKVDSFDDCWFCYDNPKVKLYLVLVGTPFDIV